MGDPDVTTNDPKLDYIMGRHEAAHRYLLRLGRAVAVRIAQREGDMDTRRVFAALSAHPVAGPLLAEMDAGGEARHRWLGALVRSCRPMVWAWTGRRADRGSAERGTNSGGEGVKVWALVAGADLSAFSFPDDVEALAEPGPAAPRPSPRAVLAGLRRDLAAARAELAGVRAGVSAACRGEAVDGPCPEAAEVAEVVRRATRDADVLRRVVALFRHAEGGDGGPGLDEAMRLGRVLADEAMRDEAERGPA